MDHAPCAAVENPRADNFSQGLGRKSREMEGSVTVGAPALVPADGGLDGEERAAAAAAAAPEVQLPVVGTNAGKRKRGRPPKGQVRAPQKKTRDEEDVCFICFDGGKLVLCDRRGCPKAYHPACIKRDESFFRSKALWNCGWHICSNCEKAAQYMCYTCTYSLCKLCISNADFLCVRGTKGLCRTCMRTVMLIEKDVQSDKEMVHVDFDDKSSWEYLFKVYWIYLKGKLSISSEELANARNPWKGASVMACNGGSSGEPYAASGNNISTRRNVVGNISKRKREKLPNFPNKADAKNVVAAGVDGQTSLPGSTQWASKGLLEFVADLRGGDTSILSQYDVQALLLEYIKRNNLRDPRVKSQIICDMRLGKLFGRARVRNSEMLKLLDFHFLTKGEARDGYTQRGSFDVVTSQVVTERINDNQPTISRDARHKICKKVDTGGQVSNLDKNAAIDVHNINLIYLKRSLVEILLEDPGKFSEKVVGAVVRIRTFTVDQKQDMYRLVQVVGTCKAAVPYKVGQRIADVMLEILNFDKKEAISIDAISNQGFSEEECRCLYQSIQSGQANCLTVGDIQKKALVLRDVKLTDCLQSEISRLSQLLDRTSEKRRRKELRESMKKLELLNTPEERQRRLREIPEVHSDPSMEHEENAQESYKKEDLFSSSRISGKGSESISPSGGSDVSNNIRSVLQKSNCEQNKSNSCGELVSGPHERADELSLNQDVDAQKSNNWDKPENQVDLSGSATIGWNKQGELKSGSSPVVGLETLASVLSAEIASSVNSIDTNKNWHYQDPNGKMQGPFSILQLGKWGGDGCFPPDLRIWRMGDTRDNSVLLTDVLRGLSRKEQPSLCENYLQSQDVRVASDDRERNWEGKGEAMNLTLAVSRQNTGTNWSEATAHPGINGEFSRDDGCCSQSSWKMSAGLANLNGKHTGSLPHGSELLGGNNSWLAQPQVHHSFPSPSVSREPCETMLQQDRDGHESKAPDSRQGYEDQNSHRSVVSHILKEQRSDGTSNSCHSSQSSGQNWKPPPQTSPFNGWPSTCTVAKSRETSGQQHENGFPDLPCPMPRETAVNQKGPSVVKLPVVSNASLLQDSGPCGSSASNLVGSGAPCPEVAGEWGGYSPNSGKPSVEERDSALASASLLRLSEAAINHPATPTSDTAHPTPSASHPAPDAPNWQVIVSGPNEFTSLGEESVSDLLAEVDAMELDGLPSPTSIMNCNGEFPQGSKSGGCFSSIEMLNPTIEPGKSDALSTSGNLQLTFKTTMMDESEPLSLSRADVLDAQKRPNVRSSTGTEFEGEAKPSDVSVNQTGTGSGVGPPAPSSRTWGTTTVTECADIGLGPKLRNEDLGRGGPPRPETADDNLTPVQGNGASGRGGSSNLGWGVSGVAHAASMSQSPRGSAMNLGVLGSQPKYTGGGERYSSTRDRGPQGRESSFVKSSRPSWNRQPSFGSGGSSRSHHKGQRVCKFHESGHCKKGAFCDYLHP